MVDGALDLSDPESSESYFYVRTLDPNGDGGHGVMPEVIGPDSMGDVHFDDYDMVVLMDVASFAPVANPKGGMDYPQMDQLEAYVRSGGGLVVFLGDKIDTNFYNSRFYNSGNGLAPSRSPGASRPGPAGPTSASRSSSSTPRASPATRSCRRSTATTPTPAS